MEDTKQTSEQKKLGLIDAFSLFLGTDDLRPEMQNPFQINDKVYATDAYTLIRCDRSYCDFEVNNPHNAPNCEGVVPTPNTSEVLNLSKLDFDQFKTEDEYELTGEDIECKACDGTGLVDWEFEHYTKEDDCPVCEGTGYEEEKGSVKTCRKTFGHFLVKLNDTYFQMKNFYKLIQVQNILGGDITLMYQSSPSKGVLFKVGACEILLMPFLYNQYESVDGVIDVR